MLGRHVVCDSCGDITLDATFEDGAYCDIDGSFDYQEITREDKRVRLPISNTHWVREAFPDPSDPIAINFEDFCPHCK